MRESFDFETIVNREGTGNLKEILTPEPLRNKNILTFNAAEMDFKTAPSVIAAMKACVENGLMGFTLCDDRFREAIRWWMKTQRNADIDAEWIVPTQGTIFSVATCIRMVCAKDERIIVQPPVYNRYKQAASRLGRETAYNPLRSDGSGGYRIDFEDLEEKMADIRNKLLVLCNPHNPLGRVWSKEDVERIAKLAVKYNVLVYSDEIFADYTFDGHEVTPYYTVNGGNNNGITAISLGKTFNFTGVNQANMIISDDRLRNEFIRQRDRDHYGSLDPVTRAAVLGAYCPEGAAWKDAARQLIWQNYQRISEFFAENLPQVKISPLQGGYVIWLDWDEFSSNRDTVHQLLEDAGWILDEGADYCIEKEGFFRMSIATPSIVVERALQRLKQVLAK